MSDLVLTITPLAIIIFIIYIYRLYCRSHTHNGIQMNQMEELVETNCLKKELIAEMTGLDAFLRTTKDRYKELTIGLNKFLYISESNDFVRYCTTCENYVTDKMKERLALNTYYHIGELKHMLHTLRECKSILLSIVASRTTLLSDFIAQDRYVRNFLPVMDMLRQRALGSSKEESRLAKFLYKTLKEVNTSHWQYVLEAKDLYDIYNKMLST